MLSKRKLPIAAGLVAAVVLSTGAIAALSTGRLTGEVIIGEPGVTGAAGDYAYSGRLGPNRWGYLEPAPGNDNTVCRTGVRQSPLNLRERSNRSGNEETAAPSDAPIEINYQPTPLKIENLGSTIEFPWGSGSSITIGDNTFDLLQFHMHTGSEHKIKGKRFPLEIHLVHAKSPSELAVLGILVAEGEEHPALAEIGSVLELNQMIPRSDQVTYSFPTLELDAAELLPEDRETFRYKGSLTTPPCTEVVDWAVFTNPIEMSAEQIELLQDVQADLRQVGRLGTNNRPLQNPYGREIALVD